MISIGMTPQNLVITKMSVMGLVETSDGGGDKIIRPHVLEFGHDIGVDDVVCNYQFFYSRKSAGSSDLIVGQTFKNKMIW